MKFRDCQRMVTGNLANHKQAIEILTRYNCLESYPTQIGSGLVRNDLRNRDISLPSRIVNETILDTRIVDSLGTNIELDSVGKMELVGSNIKASLDKSLAAAFNPNFKFVVSGWSFHKNVKWPNVQRSHAGPLTPSTPCGGGSAQGVGEGWWTWLQLTWVALTREWKQIERGLARGFLGAWVSRGARLRQAPLCRWRWPGGRVWWGHARAIL